MLDPKHETKLRALLAYEPETGFFRWLVNTPRTKAGKIAGSPHNMGYWEIRVRVEGVKYRFLAHRLAWFWGHNEWPKYLDHINGNPLDNRIANLRPATNAQNTANGKRRITNKSGYKGVVARGQRWAAHIMKNGQQIWLGAYDSPEQAYAAYTAAAKHHFGEFAKCPS